MIIKAVLALGLIGFAAGVGLSAASRFFHVPEDPRLTRLLCVLPGINCGACGFVSCEAAAKALLTGKAGINTCASGGSETADALGDVLGISSVDIGRRVAFLTCQGLAKYHYVQSPCNEGRAR